MKKHNNEIEKDFNILTQFALPAFTILAYFLIAIEKPEYGVIASLIAQPFWLCFGTVSNYPIFAIFSKFRLRLVSSTPKIHHI